MANEELINDELIPKFQKPICKLKNWNLFRYLVIRHSALNLAPSPLIPIKNANTKIH